MAISEIRVIPIAMDRPPDPRSPMHGSPRDWGRCVGASQKFFSFYKLSFFILLQHVQGVSAAVENVRCGWRGAGLWMLVASSLLQILPLTSASANPPADAADAAKVFPPTSFLTQRETWAALAVLVFGLVLGLLALLVMRQRTLPPGDVIRLSGMILIVTGTLFLVAGYSSDQIAPALGLRGTVAGYMLGRADRSPGDRGAASKADTDAKDS